MGKHKNTKGIVLASAIIATLCITFLLSPKTVYGQDVSPTDVTPTETITQSPEPTETVAPTILPLLIRQSR
jgi:hypothetical protein